MRYHLIVENKRNLILGFQYLGLMPVCTIDTVDYAIHYLQQYGMPARLTLINHAQKPEKMMDLLHWLYFYFPDQLPPEYQIESFDLQEKHSLINYLEDWKLFVQADNSNLVDVV